MVVKYNDRLYFETKPMYQYDTEQRVVLEDFDDFTFPMEVHISATKTGAVTVQRCIDGTILIPNEYLKVGRTIYIWLYLVSLDNGSKTIFAIEIPVKRRGSVPKAMESNDSGNISGGSNNTSDYKTNNEIYSLVSEQSETLLQTIAEQTETLQTIAEQTETLQTIAEQINNINEFFEDGTIIFQGMTAAERIDANEDP